MKNPLAEDYAAEPSDEDLIDLALGGSQSALEDLVRRHQGWVYNVALRILQGAQDAEDATQESLLKIVTNLAGFRRESAFRTWAYRIVFRHLLDRKRSKAEAAVHGFDCYRDYLAKAPDEEPPDRDAFPADTQLLIEEAKLSCMTGMLLCLDREQRLVFVLGEIFEVTDVVGGEVMAISRESFRQKLSRARQQLYGFMRGQCGLVDPRNPCRCAKKTRALVRDGIVDPARLVFARPHVRRIAELSAGRCKAFDAAVHQANAQLFRSHPFLDAPDIAARFRGLMAAGGLLALLDLH